MTTGTLWSFLVGILLASLSWFFAAKFIKERARGYEELLREYNEMKADSQGLHAAIGVLSDRVGEFTANVRALEGENKTLRDQVFRLQNQNQVLREQLFSLQTQQEVLVAQLNRLQGKS